MSGSSSSSTAGNHYSGGNGSDGASSNTHNSHVQESDVVECMFQPIMGTFSTRNERGNGHEGNSHEGTSNAASELGLGFDWMKVRTKDGDHESLSWPLQPHCIPKSIPHTRNNSSTTSPSSSSSIDYPLQHRMDLYLAVMNRISTTFESILSTTHFSNATTSTSTPGTSPTDTTTTTTTTTNTSTNSTLPYWKVELLRGFVYPPSATILSNVYWDGDEECGGLVSDGICTSPPIVELIRDDDDNDDDESSGSNGAKSSKRITHVRITLQGIPSKKLVSIPSMIMSNNSTRQQQQEQGAEEKKNSITSTTTIHKAQPTHSTSFPNHFSDPTLSKPKTTPTSSSSSSSSSSYDKNKQEEERKQRIKDESRRIFGPVEPQEQNISVVPVSLVFEARLSV